jgi:hypothetical protein
LQMSRNFLGNSAEATWTSTEFGQLEEFSLIELKHPPSPRVIIMKEVRWFVGEPESKQPLFFAPEADLGVLRPYSPERNRRIGLLADRNLKDWG